MLIIPVEKSINWRKPPLATLGLIILNVLIFVFYQGGDDERWQAVSEAYVDTKLVNLEAPEYLDYLERRGRLVDSDLLELAQEVKIAIKDKEWDWLASYILSDQKFRQHLEDNAARYFQADTLEDWKPQREIVNELYSKLSARAFGLIPNNIQAIDLIAYQFLHGDLMHLLGNMIFLFLFGFTVERALGQIVFISTYLGLGMISALTYSLFEWGSMTSLVGASGSISGLMGLYLAIFRLQKIRFYYNVLFYIGYFTAPALAILPVWLAKELLEFFTNQGSNVAYLAHFGGLAAGGLLYLALNKGILKVKQEFHEDEEADNLAYRQAYAKALAQISNGEFNSALKSFHALIKDNPGDPVLWEHIFHLEKLQPQQQSFHDAALRLINRNMKKGHADEVLKFYQAYKASKVELQLGEKDYSRMLFAFIKAGVWKEVQNMYLELKKHAQPDLLQQSCDMALQECTKQNQRSLINFFQQEMQQFK